MSILVRNIVSNWAGVIANLLVAFFLSPFLVHRLGDSGYGLWVLVLSVTGYMGLLDTGLRVSIVKHTAEYNARRDSEGVNRVLMTALTLYLSLSILAIVLACIASAWFATFFKVPAAEVGVGRVLVVIAGVNIALSLPMGVFGGLLSGLQRYDLLNRANILVLAARTLAIVVALLSGLGLLTLGLIQLASQVVNAVILVRVSRHEFPSMDLRPRPLHWPIVRTLYAYSGYIILNNIAVFLLFYSGEIIIGMFVGTAAVTSYALARSLVAYLSSIIGAMTQVFHPYASDQHERGNATALSRALSIGTRMSLLIALPVAIAYVVIGPAFIGLWVGPQYREATAVLLAWLTIPQIAWLSQSTAANILMGVGRHRTLTYLNIGAGVCGIALAWGLVRPFGAVGVAVGAALPILAWAAVLPIYTTRSLGLRLIEYATSAYLVPMAAALPYAIALVCVSRWWPAANLMVMGLQVVLCLAIYAPFAIVTAFERSERQRLLARFVPGTRLANQMQ